MLNVQVKGDNVNIVFSRELMKDDELMDFIERIRVKHLIFESKLTEEIALNLDKELKSNWWKQNRERFLSKIK
ncbi:MAG: hypothetical protein GTO45_08805 [Candidatus Aminicenantes bacterium]|nr:hypothetical protein [Candidatus Aminicenantes bacterium]NIM78931.1 hypothetical protein [Candidatus Aminicenantes bacterium]NIN18191.1 hypothetical protein [Candidatus Aminicenantes bacterium]NIN42090.1 hypothetical protein [Candidatus Aminicenantes bacterium]NIN84843.1 hypothetical protein [Candidatus Aminicenantes bacterium]